MTDQTPIAERTAKLEGIGCRRKRVEDIRFVQGKGYYVDDIVMPGMLFGDFVRSPFAHARIKAIRKDAALALPGVKAVLTAADLIPLNLHYMPTLAGDVQAVLAHEKVLFQNQEVVFVIATDRYVAADAVELVEVDYEELPPLIDPFKAMLADAPLLREDIKDKIEGVHGLRKHHNHIFTWGAGDKAGTDAAFASAPVTVKELISYQRCHPCPMETCASVASMDKIRGELTLWGTFQAPHVVRTVASLIAGIPEHKIRVISPDIGGGFGNKVGVYPGYVMSVVGSIVLGVPVKWVEDRIENLSATAPAAGFAPKPFSLSNRRTSVFSVRASRSLSAAVRGAAPDAACVMRVSNSIILRSRAVIMRRSRAASPLGRRDEGGRRRAEAGRRMIQ